MIMFQDISQPPTHGGSGYVISELPTEMFGAAASEASDTGCSYRGLASPLFLTCIPYALGMGRVSFQGAEISLLKVCAFNDTVPIL